MFVRKVEKSWNNQGWEHPQGKGGGRRRGQLLDLEVGENAQTVRCKHLENNLANLMFRRTGRVVETQVHLLNSYVHRKFQE